jgi:trehalose-phosphatase
MGGKTDRRIIARPLGPQLIAGGFKDQKVQPEYFFTNHDTKPGRNPHGYFLFLDFDGTLVPIQDNPTKCLLSRTIKTQLQAVLLSGKACIAILTGRAVADIKRRVQIQGLYYGGNHGLEIQGPDIIYTHPDALREKYVIEKVSREVEKGISHIEGALVEKKNLSFAVHYRMASKEDKAVIKRIFYRITVEHSDPQTVAILKGKEVLELAPRVSWDKGRAALFILQKLNNNYLPICVGDDLTDETAFKALNDTGVTVRIGRSEKTAAKYYLKGQWEMSRFLQRINDLLK